MSSIILPRRFYSQPQDAVEPNPTWRLAGLAVPQGFSELSGDVTIGLDARGDFAWVGSTANTNRRVITHDIPLYNPPGGSTFIGYYNYHDSSSSHQAIIGAATGLAGGWSMGRTSCVYRRVGGTVTLAITLPVGPPSLVVMTLDDTGGKAYVNGVLQSTDANPAQTSTSLDTGRLVGDNTSGTRAQASVLFAAWARRAMTALEVAELAINPWQIFTPRKRLLYFDAAVAGGGVALNQPSETDTAQPVGKAKYKVIGQASESDAALAVAPVKALTAGQSTESESALPVAAAKSIAIGIATETDLASALVFGLSAALGQPAEADSVASLATAKTLAIGLVTETEFAQAVAAYKSLGVLQPVEADSAHAIAATKTLTIGIVSETDSAQALGSGLSALLGQPAETDSAPAIAVRKTLALGLASDAESALALVLADYLTVDLITAPTRTTLITAPARTTLIESRHAIHG